jgi:hypothetical protein
MVKVKPPELQVKFIDKSPKAERFVNKRVETFLRNLADYAVGQTQEHLIDMGKFDTGKTVRSVTRIRTEDGLFKVKIGGSGKIILRGRGPTTGTGPGIVKRKLLSWARRKGVDTSWAPGKTVSQRLRSAAAIYARKIHRVGFGPTDFISPVKQDIRVNWSKIAAKS